MLTRINRGEVTIAELKGITDAEMAAGVEASRRLMQSGQLQAATEVLAGLALYDPFRADVWLALEELFRGQSQPDLATLFSGLARAMVA
jgi:hypothetical protein